MSFPITTLKINKVWPVKQLVNGKLLYGYIGNRDNDNQEISLSIFLSPNEPSQPVINVGDLISITAPLGSYKGRPQITLSCLDYLSTASGNEPQEAVETISKNRQAALLAGFSNEQYDLMKTATALSKTALETNSNDTYDWFLRFVLSGTSTWIGQNPGKQLPKFVIAETIKRCKFYLSQANNTKIIQNIGIDIPLDDAMI